MAVQAHCLCALDFLHSYHLFKLQDVERTPLLICLISWQPARAEHFSSSRDTRYNLLVCAVDG
jgi:hypothetical protein